jgi:hypothetical protein
VIVGARKYSRKKVLSEKKYWQYWLGRKYAAHARVASAPPGTTDGTDPNPVPRVGGIHHFSVAKINADMVGTIAEEEH